VNGSKPSDKSNGYEEMAERFMAARDPHIGPAIVRKWCQTLAPGSSVLDLGCGHGVPISQVLVEQGLDLYGIDASAKMIKAFHQRFPAAHAQCATVGDSDFFGRTFDAVIAWGLMFLLTPEVQPAVIHKIAAALNPKGRFLFTSPKDPVTWYDSITNCMSISLGAVQYRRLLQAEDLTLTGEDSDEGENHYYFAVKP
jgi:2-polyprenyl-3-methyl-5-hydroxy-6-metoxy-1,4-benzoquinol methylase